MEQNVAMPMPRPATGNIDFEVIYKHEDFRTTGYVPRVGSNKNPDANSGVTIASGFDLGEKTKEELREIFRDNPKIVQTLLPFIGKKGAAAAKIAGNLVVDEFTARQIDVAFQRHFTKKLRDSWERGTAALFTSSPFEENVPTWDELPTHQATTIASVAYQYGAESLPKRTPKFWGYATRGDWYGVEHELMHFGDETPDRREAEAKYLAEQTAKTFEGYEELFREWQEKRQQRLLELRRAYVEKHSVPTMEKIETDLKRPGAEQLSQTSSVQISTTPPHREQSQDNLGFTI